MDVQSSSSSTIILGQEERNLSSEPNKSDIPVRSQDETIDSQDITTSANPVEYKAVISYALGHGLVRDLSGSQDGTSALSMTVGASSPMVHKNTMPSVPSSEASQDVTNTSMLVNTSQDVTNAPYTSQHNTEPDTGSNTAASTDATLNVTLPCQKSIIQGDNGSMNIHESSNVTSRNVDLNMETDSSNTSQDVTS